MMISVSKASYFGGFCREHDICVNFAECYVFIYTLKKGVLIFVQMLTHLLVCFITHLLVCLATHLKVCLTHLSLSQHTLRCAEKHTLGVLNTP